MQSRKSKPPHCRCRRGTHRELALLTPVSELALERGGIPSMHEYLLFRTYEIPTIPFDVPLIHKFRALLPTVLLLNDTRATRRIGYPSSFRRVAGVQTESSATWSRHRGSRSMRPFRRAPPEDRNCAWIPRWEGQHQVGEVQNHYEER